MIDLQEQLVTAFKSLWKDFPLEKRYDWDVPNDSPIEIPPDKKGSFHQNIYLKENLSDQLYNDKNWQVHFWIIKNWGKISIKQSSIDKNQELMKLFWEQNDTGKMTKETFDRLPSLSKPASFLKPDTCFIYDARAVFSLNWLLLIHTENHNLFPQPVTRNTNLAKNHLNTLINLSDSNRETYSHQDAYFKYCQLILKVSKKLSLDKPYYLEMLLFAAAPDWITSDIKRRTQVTFSR